MAVGVEVRNNDLEKALQIFKSKVSRAGILETYKEKQYYTKPSDRKREAKKQAIRWQKRKNSSQ